MGREVAKQLAQWLAEKEGPTTHGTLPPGTGGTGPLSLKLHYFSGLEERTENVGETLPVMVSFFHLIIFSKFWVFIFVYLKGRARKEERDREKDRREIFLPLVHFLNATVGARPG